jgi:hypothetical protein
MNTVLPVFFDHSCQKLCDRNLETDLELLAFHDAQRLRAHPSEARK